ncbi:carbonic anhydrase [Stackebrandtia nassauensis]|uniref:carbonic anhydrase n=1 Tax=Stackebrandtia nassauensis (strain DSM 44728 / CIP 108903 / NRRL B-16338 / NBRC 102104 / LLR-40K-21) TaxID=446470 RepID=D3Q0W4_STANL|nr:carbonic anhydrase [Stackebrandtia nassauensis]ADD43714.1 carbonic anhydrase [Stackebrandtia nassauensis DSM 44728]
MRLKPVHRRTLLTTAGLAVAGTAGTVALAPSAIAEDQAASPDAALDRLMRGNRRYIKGHSRHPHQSLEYLHEVAKGQHPFAITIGCADSRVPPEILFDQGLGDVFDHRIAGNIPDELLLGSIEFAIEEFAPPLLMALGHERCGAITATIDAIESGTEPPGHIAAIVEALRPVVEPVLDEPGDKVENGVRANIVDVVEQLQRRSDIVAEKVEAGELTVVGARYDLDTGKVTLVD